MPSNLLGLAHSSDDVAFESFHYRNDESVDEDECLLLYSLVISNDSVHERF
jgi:hypothetical protein